MTPLPFIVINLFDLSSASTMLLQESALFASSSKWIAIFNHYTNYKAIRTHYPSSEITNLSARALVRKYEARFIAIEGKPSPPWP